MATESIIGFSDLPLRLAAAFGFAVTVVGILLIVGLVVQRLFFVEMLPGYTSTLGAIVLLGGANLMSLGLVGLYVGRILREVQDRPQYVIQSFENFAPGDDDHAGLTGGHEPNVLEQMPSKRETLP
jgi:dolichol-phosphate mannosyltransferase